MRYKVTRKDCQRVIGELIRIFKEVELSNEIDFLVYGTYFGKWRNGLSDLDGVLSFSKSFIDPQLRFKILAFQMKMRELYENIEFLKTGHFFADVFVLDKELVEDGRFMIYDKGFIDRIVNGQTKQAVLFGEDFVRKLNPVSLRHQDEFELAAGVQKLRNYLLFEIPKPVNIIDLNCAIGVTKFFKILPRTVAIILGESLISTIEEMTKLRNYLEEIDYSYLERFFEASFDPDFIVEHIRSWHEIGNEAFLDYLVCFEKVLQAVIKNESMLSLGGNRGINE
ncbi:hypothetical protein ACFLZC_00580 [Patescibacteria group bacterium]